MNETLTLSLWEDLIHNQRWEELRAKLAATHSSDIAEALGQIHGKEQAVVFRLLPRDQAAQVFSYLPADRQKAVNTGAKLTLALHRNCLILLGKLPLR